MSDNIKLATRAACYAEDLAALVKKFEGLWRDAPRPGTFGDRFEALDDLADFTDRLQKDAELAAMIARKIGRMA